jgi:hypothetical protein
LPALAQAARLTRHIDLAKPKKEEVETEWRVTFRPPAAMSAEAMCLAD